MDDFLVDLLQRLLQVIDDKTLILEGDGLVGLTGGQFIGLQVDRIFVDLGLDVLVDFTSLLHVFVLCLHGHVVYDLVVVRLAFGQHCLESLHLSHQIGLFLLEFVGLSEDLDELLIFSLDLLLLLLVI